MADPLDVLTLAEAKPAIGMDAADTTHDVELARFITRVSRLLDEKCGPVVAREVTERHDGGRWFVLLEEYPVSSFTSVTEHTGTTAAALTEETVGVQPAKGFLLDAERILYRRSAGSDALFPRGRRNVAVVFQAGRYATTAAVDERFKGAAAITMAQYWRREHGMGTVTFGPEGQVFAGATFLLPNAARALVERDLRADEIGLVVG